MKQAVHDVRTVWNKVVESPIWQWTGWATSAWYSNRSWRQSGGEGWRRETKASLDGPEQPQCWGKRAEAQKRQAAARFICKCSISRKSENGNYCEELGSDVIIQSVKIWLVFKQASKDTLTEKFMLSYIYATEYVIDTTFTFCDTPIPLQITLGLHSLSFSFNMVSNSSAIIKLQQAKHMTPELLCCLTQNETHKVLICPWLVLRKSGCYLLLLLLLSLFFSHLKEVLIIYLLWIVDKLK